MDTAFNDFDAELKDLTPEVRKKALEIAAKLISNKGYDKARALKQAIQEAESWFLDLEG